MKGSVEPNLVAYCELPLHSGLQHFLIGCVSQDASSSLWTITLQMPGSGGAASLFTVAVVPGGKALNNASAAFKA